MHYTKIYSEIALACIQNYQKKEELFDDWQKGKIIIKEKDFCENSEGSYGKYAKKPPPLVLWVTSKWRGGVPGWNG